MLVTDLIKTQPGTQYNYYRLSKHASSPRMVSPIIKPLDWFAVFRLWQYSNFKFL